MNRLEAQQALFSFSPTRMMLQSVDINDFARVSKRINVWRNHAIEPVLALARPYLSYGGWHADFLVSGYDDALSFSAHGDVDLEIVWLDSERYWSSMTADNWVSWIAARLTKLRAMSKVPIVLATWVGTDAIAASVRAALDVIPACHFADMREACEPSGAPLLDHRSSLVAGTPVNPRVHGWLARELACRWMPACLFPPIKAIALDLDNTLHAGVLGEDGPVGVKLNDSHKALQEHLLELRQRGIFLALVSRNETSDVQGMFEIRRDYPLRWEHFSVTDISWGNKADAISNVAQTLRISVDSILFVDDNPGEIISVTNRFPEIHAVLADAGAHVTARAISYYPALWRWNFGQDDMQRVADFEANASRDRLLLEAEDSAAYFRSLGVRLTVRVDPRDQLSRLSELSSKTNQFNLALRRFGEAEIAERIDRSDACVVSVALSDSLSDSGVIALLVAERVGNSLVVEDLCISCRALGRHIEDVIVVSCLRAMPLFNACGEVVFRAECGPRNEPARTWLARILSSEPIVGSGAHSIPSAIVNNFAIPADLKLSIL